MKKHHTALLLCTLFILGSTTSLQAKSIILGVGESYSEDDLNIMCVDKTSATLIELKDCQFWDDFKERCLYEKKIYSYGTLECVEECQHWDSFKEVCDYATKCTFYPDQKVFVRTSCEKFDDFNRRCLKTKEKKISRHR